MASGLSSRFGTNKLLTEFKGRRLIDIVLDNTATLSEEQEVSRLVLTRTSEVYDYCLKNNIKTVLHNLPNRNEAVALGLSQFEDYDACIFCACDQPFLKKESIQKLIENFCVYGKGIYRLAYEEKVGNPILFSCEYYSELKNLPEKKGGSYLALKHPEDVVLVNASDELELYDIDTPDDLIMLSRFERK